MREMVCEECLDLNHEIKIASRYFDTWGECCECGCRTWLISLDDALEISEQIGGDN